MPIPVLIDCDPGYDDVIAIMLALASPEVEVLGITTVEGNQPVAETTENALRVVEFLARDCRNVATWFTARGLAVDAETLFGEVIAYAW